MAQPAATGASTQTAAAVAALRTLIVMAAQPSVDDPVDRYFRRILPIPPARGASGGTGHLRARYIAHSRNGLRHLEPVAALPLDLGWPQRDEQSGLL